MMIILERDKPKHIITWSIIFLFLPIIGYAGYLIIRNIIYKKRKSLEIKLKEDEIYDKLISNNLINNKTVCNNEVMNFNSLAFNTKTTANNKYKFIHEYSLLKESLFEDINNAKDYIFLELRKINNKDLQEIKTLLIEKALENVAVKFIYDEPIGFRVLKELRKAGVKAYRFSKHNSPSNLYSNLRNLITIDGKIVYIANLNISNKQLNSEKETAHTFMRLEGDAVQDIDIQIHKDTIFAGGKFVPYEKHERVEFDNNNIVQVVSNNIKTDLELALIKAICMAKKSIQLELSEFIPTESIKSLLRFAINSNIDVRLMVPFENVRHSNYYASRAYAKELALLGANVYLFDGYINFNAIVIDDLYTIFGSYILDREHLNNSLQTMLFIKDQEAVENFNNMFEKGIENSYRINNAKFMLLREKFFKNFV